MPLLQQVRPDWPRPLRQQKKDMIDLTKEKAFKIMMDYTHWNVDARLVHDYFWKSGSTIDWLQDMGVQFHHIGPYYAGGYHTAHFILPEGGGEPGPRAASAMIKVMFKHAQELGVKFYFEAPVTEIRKDGDKVNGFMAKGSDGEEYEVTSKAVIICTGGFGNNVKMIKEFTGYEWGKDMFSFQIPGITGDGIRLAWAAGAGRGRMSLERITECPINANMKYFSYKAFLQPRALTVNQLGDRRKEILCRPFLQRSLRFVRRNQDKLQTGSSDGRLEEDSGTLCRRNRRQRYLCRNLSLPAGRQHDGICAELRAYCR